MAYSADEMINRYNTESMPYWMSLGRSDVDFSTGTPRWNDTGNEANIAAYLDGIGMVNKGDNGSWIVQQMNAPEGSPYTQWTPDGKGGYTPEQKIPKGPDFLDKVGGVMEWAVPLMIGAMGAGALGYAGAGVGAAETGAGVGAAETGAGAGTMGGMSTAEMAAAAYPAAGTEAALGSGMTGMGLEAATPALTGVGAAEAGAGIGGMSAAEMAAAAWPEVGSTVAGGAGGTLGSGLYGTGVADIGAAMGTVGDIGSGLGSMGDLSSILNGNYLGDYGVDSYYPQPSNSFVQSAPTDMDPYANETAKFMRQDAMQPGEYWDKNLTMPTVDTSSSSWLENQIKKQGTDLIKNQIKQALTPSQQGARPPAGATSYATTAPLPSTGAPASMGALQQVTQQRQAPMGGSPVDSNYSRMEQELRRQLRDSRYTTSNSGMDFMPLNNLQNNNGDATLAGYELWKALNQPSNQR